ncbi:hypothetical protein J2W35_006927 [Variovorax boronicumulans]|uniref:hypothetical protein n=1 Tax=Variovorax boronicumulans TaxID=436515 RepID=UPI002789CCA2|nr:hypothetical protein [Variovorax boronicumulans]MDQ0086544.1 hypothetical protein [Variovorax boronicumulans]
MAKQARTFRVTFKDGKKSTTVPVVAASKVAARKLVEKNLTPHHAVTDVEHTGFRAFQVVPAEDDSGPVFKSCDGKDPLEFHPTDPSQEYLQGQFPIQTAKVEKFIDDQNRSDF